MSEVAESTQKPAQSRSEGMAQQAEEEPVTAFQYIAVNLNGAEKSPVVKSSPSLPPLIKIDQTIPVGYTAIAVAAPDNNSTANNSSEHQQKTPSNSSNGYTMTSTSDPSSPTPHYRPTIINLAPPPSTTTGGSMSSSGGGSPPLTSPLTTLTPVTSHSPPLPYPPKPLVEPLDSDRPERMRDWLVRMINSGQFPGLKWLDQEKMVFRVPWIHAKKRDYNQERDAALFREWAIHSGKYGDGSDVTTWKINFRCALNGLKDIMERRDLEEPDCRVYQMLPPSGTSRRRRKRRPGSYYSSTGEFGGFTSPDRDVRPRLELQSPVATPTMSVAAVTALTPTSGVPPITVLPLLPANSPIRLPIVPSPTTPQATPVGVIQKLRSFYPAVTAGMPTPLTLTPQAEVVDNHRGSKEREGSSSQPQTPRTPISPVVQQQFSPKIISPPPPPPSSALQSSHNLHSSTNSNALGAVTTITMHPALRTGPVYCPPTEFCNNPNAVTVRVMYGSITVHLETFDCSQGSRIFYGPLHCRDILAPEVEEKLFGPLDAHQISLSPRHPASLSKDIFSSMKRGLVLEVEEECIYATALCRAVVYHGCSPVKNTGALAKEERTKVFNFNHRFMPSLKYTANGQTQPPKPYVIFSLGQPWGAERPLSKNLVTVVVTYCKALNELRVRNTPIHDELLFEAQEAKDIRIIAPTQGDLEAEEFLNPGGNPSTPN